MQQFIQVLKQTITVLLILFFVVTARSQTKLKSSSHAVVMGKVVDSTTFKPLEYATISLLKKNTPVPVKGSISDNKGNFIINDPLPGNYTLVIGFVNYSTVTYSDVVIKQSTVKDFKTIYLKKKSGLLSAINITAAQPKVIENKIDKIVFNADQDITSQGGVALDILKKVPQVSVDIDGNVQLSGSSGIRFLIDGKPSSAFGNHITDILQSIPASEVKSIEVITNPGAKYDAEGLAGIINIVLKKNTASGVNGNLSLTTGTIIENGAFNFNARKNNFGINVFANANARLAVKSLNTYNRTSNDDIARQTEVLNQNGYTTFARKGLEAGLGFDWTYKKKNSFSGNIIYNFLGDSTEGFYYQSQKTTPYSGSASSFINTNNFYGDHSSYHAIDANIEYKRTFTKEGRSLEFAINSSFGNDGYTESNRQFVLPQDTINFGSINNNPGKENQVEFKLDYNDAVTKQITLNAGGKVTINDVITSSAVLGYDNGFRKYMFDTSLSNSLRYYQVVSAAYAEVSFPAGKLFDVNIGGRFEHTNIQPYFFNVLGDLPKPAYNTFVPSVFLLRNINEKQTLKLSYTKRIQRPEYSELNPFINTSDPKNITRGNPFLIPETGNRLELSYNWDISAKNSLNITAFYRTSKNDIQNYVVYYPYLKVGDSVYENVAVNTNENVGIERNTGVSLSGSASFTKKLSVRLNAFGFYRYTNNIIDTGYNAQSFNYRFNVNVSYQFAKSVVAEFSGNFNSARHEVQGSYPSFMIYSLAIRKQFWKKNGSLALTTTDPFNEYTNKRTSISGPSFTVDALRRMRYRSVGINFTWKFGNLEFKNVREDNSRNINSAE